MIEEAMDNKVSAPACLPAWGKPHSAAAQWC